MQLTLPPQLRADGRVYLYGFDVTPDWLVNYSKASWKDHTLFHVTEQMSVGLQTLKRSTNIKTLVPALALVDNAAPPDAAVEGHRRGEPMVPILSIYSNEQSSYHRRPSHA